MVTVFWVSLTSVNSVFIEALGSRLWPFGYGFGGDGMRKPGFEPGHLSVPDPKSGASASSATFASLQTISRQLARQAPFGFQRGLGHPRPNGSQHVRNDQFVHGAP